MPMSAGTPYGGYQPGGGWQHDGHYSMGYGQQYGGMPHTPHMHGGGMSYGMPYGGMSHMPYGYGGSGMHYGQYGMPYGGMSHMPYGYGGGGLQGGWPQMMPYGYGGGYPPREFDDTFIPGYDMGMGQVY